MGENGGMNAASPQPILSPCVNVCEMGEDGLCEGCLRTLDEIAAWGVMSPQMRLHVIDVLIPGRGTGRA